MKYGNRARSGPRAKRILGSPFVLLGLLVILAFVVHAAWSIHARAVQSATKLSQAQDELSKLQARQSDLSAKVAYLSTDAGVEAELRDKFHAVNDGESVAVILDGDQQAANASIAASSTPQRSWWQNVLHMFGL